MDVLDVLVVKGQDSARLSLIERLREWPLAETIALRQYLVSILEEAYKEHEGGYLEDDDVLFFIEQVKQRLGLDSNIERKR